MVQKKSTLTGNKISELLKAAPREGSGFFAECAAIFCDGRTLVRRRRKIFSVKVTKIHRKFCDFF